MAPSLDFLRRSSTRLGALAAAAALLVLPLLAAPPAEAAVSSTGWLRTAHLSPDTGAVDVWLTPFGGSSSSAAVPDVTYGNVTPYRSLAPGYYTVAMRPAGSPASTPAMLSDTVQIVAGHAYSVLAVGASSALSFHVVADDLTAPAPARSRVRLIQASTAQLALDVRAVAGPILVQDAGYGLVSPYSEVPQGRWNLQIAAAAGGGTPTTAQVDLRAGSVTTLLVLNGPAGSGVVTLKPVLDAGAASVAPRGGVNTGEGGMAGGAADAGPSGAFNAAGLVTPALLGLAAFALVLRRRLARPVLAPAPAPAAPRQSAR
jgi:hypothetical protein